MFLLLLAVAAEAATAVVVVAAVVDIALKVVACFVFSNPGISRLFFFFQKNVPNAFEIVFSIPGPPLDLWRGRPAGRVLRLPSKGQKRQSYIL